MNGLYASMGTQHPYLDEASQPIRFWPTSTRQVQRRPDGVLGYGYTIVDAFARAASKAGNNLTTDGFIKADGHHGDPQTCSAAPKPATARRSAWAVTASRLSQIVDGKWKVISDYVTP